MWSHIPFYLTLNYAWFLCDCYLPLQPQLSVFDQWQHCPLSTICYPLATLKNLHLEMVQGPLIIHQLETKIQNSLMVVINYILKFSCNAQNSPIHKNPPISEAFLWDSWSIFCEAFGYSLANIYGGYLEILRSL